jgi:MarR family 2-MHQ and catechol resistance regulon transcriptional repressor
MMASESAEPLEEILYRTAYRLRGLERRWIREKLRMGESDFGILRCLGRCGVLPVSSVGCKLLLTSGSITTAIDRMVRRGMVVRTIHPSDRRRVLVDLTSEGRVLLKATLPAYRAWLEQGFSTLSVVEKAQLADLLRKM